MPTPVSCLKLWYENEEALIRTNSEQTPCIFQISKFLILRWEYLVGTVPIYSAEGVPHYGGPAGEGVGICS